MLRLLLLLQFAGVNADAGRLATHLVLARPPLACCSSSSVCAGFCRFHCSTTSLCRQCSVIFPSNVCATGLRTIVVIIAGGIGDLDE